MDVDEGHRDDGEGSDELSMAYPAIDEHMGVDLSGPQITRERSVPPVAVLSVANTTSGSSRESSPVQVAKSMGTANSERRCTRCSRPAERNRKKCSRCLEVSRRHSKKYHLNKKKAGTKEVVATEHITSTSALPSLSARSEECSITGCHIIPESAHKLCDKHREYYRMRSQIRAARRRGEAEAEQPSTRALPGICGARGCNRPPGTAKLCPMHRELKFKQKYDSLNRRVEREMMQGEEGGAPADESRAYLPTPPVEESRAASTSPKASTSAIKDSGPPKDPSHTGSASVTASMAVMTESLAAQINGAMKSSTLSKQDNNGRGESSAKKRKRDDNEGANTPSLPEASEPAPHKAGQRIPTKEMAPVYQFWDELYRALSSLRAPLNFTSKSRDGAKLYTYRHVQTFKGAFSIISDPKINHYQRAQLVYKELYFKTGLRMRADVTRPPRFKIGDEFFTHVFICDCGVLPPEDNPALTSANSSSVSAPSQRPNGQFRPCHGRVTIRCIPDTSHQFFGGQKVIIHLRHPTGEVPTDEDRNNGPRHYKNRH